MRFKAFSIMLSFFVQAMASQAWAGATQQPHQGQILLLLFLGVGILIVVYQMVPALILLLESLSGIAKRVAARKQAVAVGAGRDKSE